MLQSSNRLIAGKYFSMQQLKIAPKLKRYLKLALLVSPFLLITSAFSAPSYFNKSQKKVATNPVIPVVIYPHAGFYVYGVAQADERNKTPALLSGGVQLVNEAVLSFEEVQEINALEKKERTIQAQQFSVQTIIDEKNQSRNARKNSLKLAHAAGDEIIWPKVLLVKSKICVPAIEFANDPRWQSHLLCTERVESEVLQVKRK